MSGDVPGRDDGWVALLDGIRVSRRWISEHAPELLTAWCEAPTRQRRQAIVAVILGIAADLESEPAADVVRDEADAARAWRATAEQLDRRLVHGPDWPPLAAALARAAAAGYDVAARLPALAAAAPLPGRHRARELHWRLLDDCPAALPVLPEAKQGAVHNRSGDPQISAEHPPAGRDHTPLNRTESRNREDQP